MSILHEAGGDDRGARVVRGGLVSRPGDRLRGERQCQARVFAYMAEGGRAERSDETFLGLPACSSGPLGVCTRLVGGPVGDQR